jgi:hypothetical protein
MKTIPPENAHRAKEADCRVFCKKLQVTASNRDAREQPIRGLTRIRVESTEYCVGKRTFSKHRNASAAAGGYIF